jgi:hypothetical protein
MGKPGLMTRAVRFHLTAMPQRRARGFQQGFEQRGLPAAIGADQRDGAGAVQVCRGARMHRAGPWGEIYDANLGETVHRMQERTFRCESRKKGLLFVDKK